MTFQMGPGLGTARAIVSPGLGHEEISGGAYRSGGQYVEGAAATGAPAEARVSGAPLGVD